MRKYKPIEKELPCGALVKEVITDYSATYVEIHISNGDNFVRAYHQNEVNLVDRGVDTGIAVYDKETNKYIGFKDTADLIIRRDNLPVLRRLIDRLIKQGGKRA